jgi:hypothetical protein
MGCSHAVCVGQRLEEFYVCSFQHSLIFPGTRKPLINKKYELSLVYSNESHQIAAKAYFDWWENNKQKNFNEFKNIDPLKFTDYRWH